MTNFSFANPTVEPVSVSPFIRASRWGLLIMGVLWGMQRHRSISKQEAKLREIEERERPEREAKAKAAKLESYKAEMKRLAVDFNVPIPKDFDEQFK